MIVLGLGLALVLILVLRSGKACKSPRVGRKTRRGPTPSRLALVLGLGSALLFVYLFIHCLFKVNIRVSVRFRPTAGDRGLALALMVRLVLGLALGVQCKSPRVRRTTRRGCTPNRLGFD